MSCINHKRGRQIVYIEAEGVEKDQYEVNKQTGLHVVVIPVY